MIPSLKNIITCACIALSLSAQAQTSPKLNGTVIGITPSYDYSTSQQSDIVNTPQCAFDGDLNTFYASYDRSNTWVGLDLGTPHRITGVAWSPRDNENGPRRTRLAIFEGANREDFLDAVPLLMTDEDGTVGTMSYADVNVTRSFRYVRYVGPNESRCNVAEVAFYGDEVTEEATGKETLYKPTNLPLVIVHVKDAEEPYDKEHDLEMICTIISADGKKILSEPGTIRLRGNASMGFPKKPYRLKFDKKQTVLGSPAKAKKWTLINSYGDKTLMRNNLAFDMSQRVGLLYTPFCTSVEVMVNGEYKGCYQLCDQIEVAAGRVDIDKMDETCTEGEALTGGYLIEVDAYANQETSYFYSNKDNPVTIKYPSDDEILPEQSDYIRNVFNTMEANLFKGGMTVNQNYWNYLDVESFLKHFIVGEFSGNTDTYWSTYMYKYRSNDKLYVGPVWDFDLAYENDNRTYPINKNTDYIYATDGSYAGNMRDFVNRIIKRDNIAKQELADMWAQLRSSGVVTQEALLAVVDDNAKNIDAAQRLNFMRWDIMNTYVHQNPVIWGSYEAEVDNVRDYIKKRIAWFDAKLGYRATPIENVNRDNTSSAPCSVYSVSGTLLGTYPSLAAAHDAVGRGVFIISQDSKHHKVTF